MENNIISLQNHIESIELEYNNSNNSKNYDHINNKILDVFEEYYARYLKNNQNEEELENFIMHFTQDKFNKKIHYCIWTAFAFYEQTNLTRKVIKLMREKYK